MVEVPIDTDALGTFTGTVARTMPALEAARTKANLAAAARPGHLGLGSEASFAPLGVGGGVLEEELVVLLNPVDGTMAFGRAEAVVEVLDGVVANLAALELLVADRDLETHGLVLWPEHLGAHQARELTDQADLEVVAAALWALSPGDRLRVRSDLRAHRNALRRTLLSEAAESLVHELTTPCRCCGSRASWQHRSVPVVCDQCHRLAPLGCTEVTCQRCGTRRSLSDASPCAWCTP